MNGKQVSILFKDIEPLTTDFETWEIGEKTKHEILDLNADTIQLCTKDSQIIVKKPTLKKAKKLTIGKESLILENTDRTKKPIRKEELISKNKKKHQDKITKFSKLRNQSYIIKKPEDKSLLFYAKQKSKSLMTTFALYCFGAFFVISVPVGIDEIGKLLKSKDLIQEFFSKLEDTFPKFQNHYIFS